jgi:hypothetical protein
MDSPDRRTFIKGLTGALALGGAGVASGHPSFGGGHVIHRHGKTKNADLVGFHTLGDYGSESVGGGPDTPLYGMITDVWIEGDLGFVSMQTTSSPTGNRGVAILDVSAYTAAESREELDDGEMTVLSFIGNETEAGTGNSVKVSDDGQYLAYSKQAIGTTYGERGDQFTDFSTSTEDHDAPGPNVTGVEVYDISDPGNPDYVGSGQGPHAGFHNCFVHRIGGNEYVFGIQGTGPGTSGVQIFRITPAGVVPVNFWGGDEFPVTDYGTNAIGGLAGLPGFYCHDFYAHDDPKTGTPMGFAANWNFGAVALDLSDPTDIKTLGRGKGMPRTHYVQPTPAEVAGTRLLVGGQEHTSQSNDISGEIAIWDLDAIIDGEGFTEVDPLASYTLYDQVSYSGYHFSPHNNDVIVEPDGEAWIVQAHYHAGIRFLKIEPPGEGRTDGWHIAGRRVRSTNDRPITQEQKEDGEGFVRTFETDDNGVFTSGFENARLAEEAEAYYRSHVEVPPESATDDDTFPNFWDARTRNGVTFGTGQHTGLYAIAAEPIEVGTRTAADVSVERSENGGGLLAGEPTRLSYEVKTDTLVRIRDRLPSSSEVLGGDAHTTYDTGDGLRVEFDEPVEPTGSGVESRTLVVSAGDPEGLQAGPVEVATDADPSKGGRDWDTIADTV